MKFKSVTKATSEAGTVNPTGASEFTPGCWRVTCCLNFSFLCSVLWIAVCAFVLFPLATVLSVLLRFTESEYPCGIFRLFFSY